MGRWTAERLADDGRRCRWLVCVGVVPRSSCGCVCGSPLCVCVC